MLVAIIVLSAGVVALTAAVTIGARLDLSWERRGRQADREAWQNERDAWNGERLALLERLDALRVPVIGPPADVGATLAPDTEAAEYEADEVARRRRLLTEAGIEA